MPSRVLKKTLIQADSLQGGATFLSYYMGLRGADHWPGSMSRFGMSRTVKIKGLVTLSSTLSWLSHVASLRDGNMMKTPLNNFHG